MSVNALNSANGADLLQRYMQSTQQTSAANVASNSADVLKTAVAEAKLSESSLVSGGDPITSGSLVNLFA